MLILLAEITFSEDRSQDHREGVQYETGTQNTPHFCQDCNMELKECFRIYHS
jgi:hypothetical protein